MAEPTVLVVDDNEGFLRVVRAALAEGTPPLRVHGVGTGGEALAWLAASHADPAFVVLDFRLPDINAPEVLRRLRGMPRHTTLPVLVLSQADWPHDATAAREAGADQFELKPSRVAPLTNLIRGFWAVHQSRPRT